MQGILITSGLLLLYICMTLKSPKQCRLNNGNYPFMVSCNFVPVKVTSSSAWNICEDVVREYNIFLQTFVCMYEDPRRTAYKGVINNNGYYLVSK